ncbi:MAG: phosphoglycolate phosphatase [Alphaproteobacteria bacterium]
MTGTPPESLRAPSPKAIIFDWDNTLVETWPVIHAALHDTFVAMDVTPWTYEQTRSRVRHSMRESFPKLFHDRWETARDVFYAAYEKAHLEHLKPCVGASDLLFSLNKMAIPLCVISNKTGRYLRLEATHLAWSSYFGRLVGAGDAARDKPAPEPVAMALDGTGVAPGPDVWMVGDSGVDMEIAHATGLNPVVLRHEPAPDGEFDEFEPRLRFESCAALLAYINELKVA